MKNGTGRVSKKKNGRKSKMKTQGTNTKPLIFTERVRNLLNKQSIMGFSNNVKGSISDFRVLINANPKTTVAICILILIAIFSMVIVYFLMNNTKGFKFPSPSPFPYGNQTSSTVSTPSPKPTPTPIPLVQGPQTFSIGMKGTPEMYEVWFNTIDPKNNTQEVRLKVRDKLGEISSATATVKTDKLSKNYNLSFSEGTASDGQWTGSWTLNDTYNRNFVITFSVADYKGNKSSVDMTIR